MHIAVDGVGNRSGGGLSVLLRTVDGLLRDPRVDHVTVYGAPADLLTARVPVAANLTWVTRRAETESLSSRRRWYREELSACADRVGAEAVVSMNGLGHTRLPRIAVVQQAFCFADELAAQRPLSFRLRQTAIRTATLAALRRADAVVVQSDWMASQAATSIHGTAQIHVLPLGLPRSRAVVAPRASEVVTVTNGLPYKQTAVAETAMQIAVDTGGAPSRRVIRGGLSPDELSEVLAHAAGLVIASDVESLGLPVVEAFAVGCPVVLADREWSRSVAAEGAIYFDPGDAAAAGELLRLVATDAGLRHRLVAQGRARLNELWEPDPYRSLVDLLEKLR